MQYVICKNWLLDEDDSMEEIKLWLQPYDSNNQIILPDETVRGISVFFTAPDQAVIDASTDGAFGHEDWGELGEDGYWYPSGSGCTVEDMLDGFWIPDEDDGDRYLIFKDKASCKAHLQSLLANTPKDSFAYKYYKTVEAGLGGQS